MKLLNWIELDKLNFNNLSLNPNAIDLLKNNFDKINWLNMAKNPNGYLIIQDNIEILKNDKEIREIFIKNCQCMELLKNIIKLEPNDNNMKSALKALSQEKNAKEKEWYSKMSGFYNSDKLKKVVQKDEEEAIIREKVKRQLIADE